MTCAPTPGSDPGLLEGVVVQYNALAVRFNALAARTRELEGVVGRYDALVTRTRELHDRSQATITLLSSRLAREAEARDGDRDRARECVVCLQPAGPWAMLRPCGHVCVCGECARALDRCPVCRGAIAERLKAFI